MRKWGSLSVECELWGLCVLEVKLLCQTTNVTTFSCDSAYQQAAKLKYEVCGMYGKCGNGAACLWNHCNVNFVACICPLEETVRAQSMLECKCATAFSAISDVFCKSCGKSCMTINWTCKNSLKLVIPLRSLYWSIPTKDESKRGTAFAFIFGVNWLWHCGVTASFRVFLREMKCNGMTSFMEFMYGSSRNFDYRLK